MPRDLFGAVAAGTAGLPAARSRKSTLLTVSIATHTLVILLVAAVQVGQVGRWPTPRQVLAFYDQPRLARPTDIALPPVRRHPDDASSHSESVRKEAPSIPSPPAPLTEPSGIAPDTSPDGLTTSGSGGLGIEDGPRGIPDDVGIKVAPPTRPPAQTPIRPHSGIRAPAKIVHVAPLYPPLARATKVQGIVIIEATIDVHGNVESARVLRSEALLDQAALDAVRQWKFSPTLLNGVAVPIVMTVTVNFRLDQ